MDHKTLAYLLRIVKNNSDISLLTDLGYYYSQVILLLSEAVENNYLTRENLSYRLTEKGAKFLLSYSEQNNEKGIERWVLPQTNKMVISCGKYDIILPGKM